MVKIKRLGAILIAVACAGVVAVTIGLGVGLRQKPNKETTTSSSLQHKGLRQKPNIETTISSSLQHNGLSEKPNKETTTSSSLQHNGLSQKTNKETTTSSSLQHNGLSQKPNKETTTSSSLQHNGLSQKPNKEATCFSSLQHNGTKNYNPNLEWDGVCPNTDQPSCPDGINQPLILISMDGFRAEYLTRNFTPTMSRLAECGFRARYLRSVYPSKTFPNHYTIVTGLYPESHGIIANKMYDLNLHEDFSIGSPNSFNSHWWKGEPIWVSAVKESKKSVTLYWPGSEVVIQGFRPSFCYQYDQSVSFEDRVNEIMAYFSTDPSQFPSFVTFYMHEPDKSGHRGGPHDKRVAASLAHVDHVINLLMSGLQQKNLLDCVNVIIVSDHGLDSVHCKRTINLAPYFGDMLEELHFYDKEQVRVTSQFIFKDDEFIETPGGATADEILDKVKCTNYNDTKDWYVRFDKKEDLPKRLHYCNNVRIEEVIGEVQTQFLAFRDTDGEISCSGGAHGFDPVYDSMHGIFLGAGPSFQAGYEAEAADSIELYNLMAELLHLEHPAPNNGTYGSLHHLLSTASSLPPPPTPEGTYSSCLYPEDDNEAAKRRNSTHTCNWIDLKNYTLTPISDIDEQLNLDSVDKNISIASHTPLGLPEVDFSDADACQLIQNDYIIGFSHRHKMTLWTAFKLSKNDSCSYPDKDCFRSDNMAADLIRPDIRLSVDEQTECDLYTNQSAHIEAFFLFPPGLINRTLNPDQPFDAHISTNVVPMYEQFRTGVWQVLFNLLEEYTYKYGDLHVTMGPIFDYNADGRRDTDDEIQSYVKEGTVPIPTHYYMMAYRCQDVGVPPEGCTSDIVVLSVVLRHKEEVTNCWDQRYLDYIEKNVVRVRDIELLTGLRFHPALSERRRLQMSVSLPETLWDRVGWLDIPETDGDQCPILGVGRNCPSGFDPDHPPLLLISIDGLRPDYIDRGLTPILKKIRDCGTHAEYMRSIYPTKTFPNHYTIVTGMYPESHGIVDNNMYDMQLKEAFWLGSPNSFNPKWWMGEPLWNNVQKHNKTAVTLFWPGSEVEIGGMRPEQYFLYDSNMPHELRVSTVLDWLENGANGKLPDFITLYFSSVDWAGHGGGPNSLIVSEALLDTDRSIKSLMDGIYRLGLHQCINIIISSDHGMADTLCDWNVILNDYINMNLFRRKTHLYPGPAARMSNRYYRNSRYKYFLLSPREQVSKEDIIKSLTCKSPTMNVFNKIDLPKRYHYAKHERIDDIIFVTADSWSVNKFSPWCKLLGNHGWDPYFQSMKAYFSAYGPDFNDKLEIDAFENIELYNLMNYLIGIEPSANNDTEGSLYHVLRNPPSLKLATSLPHTKCEYPENNDEYEDRSDLEKVQCTCNAYNSSQIKEADLRLNLSGSSQSEAESRHVPYGLPSIQDDSVCVLHSERFVSGYSHNRNVSLWTAFTLNGTEKVAYPAIDCLRPDVRMDQSQQASCADFYLENITTGFLFPPVWSQNLEQMDALVLSNAVPMFAGFWSGVWHRLMNRLKNWALTYRTIHVITGPIYDDDANGLADKNSSSSMPALPSHYYTIVLKCPKSNCSGDMSYDVMSFIMSHKPNVSNCQTEDQYLLDNVARIRDIELLTDLQFLANTTSSRAVRTRTFIPTSLWPISRHYNTFVNKISAS